MFNQQLAQRMFNVTTENDLREVINGERSGITDGELSCILKHLKQFKNPVYCEIGVYFGGTFKRVLEALDGDYWAIGIDLFEDLVNDNSNTNQTHELYNKWNILNVAYRDDLESKLSRLGFSNFELLKGVSDQQLDTLSLRSTKRPNLVFIDGNHTYEQTMKDFVSAKKALANGEGIVVFHNASNDIPPDHEYVKKDGGPWLVCNDIQKNGDAEFVESIERCQVFKVVKNG